MKLIIAGGRKYYLTELDHALLDDLNSKNKVDEVVSGGCKTGADRCGELWAEWRGIPVKQFLAEWRKYGNAAGPIRNRQMAEHADAVALFPGGRGTQSMYEEARRAGIIIFDFRDAHT